MTKTDVQTHGYGSPDFDISSVLGPKTRQALATVRSGGAFVIKERSHGNLSTATILASGGSLNSEQIQNIQAAANEPCAYYNGRPVFRRLPPQQNFAIQLQGAAETLDLMIDLRNAGWGFYCGGETYQDWNWVGRVFVAIAKASFPDLASKHNDSVWREGAIARLQAEFDGR